MERTADVQRHHPTHTAFSGQRRGSSNAVLGATDHDLSWCVEVGEHHHLTGRASRFVADLHDICRVHAEERTHRPVAHRRHGTPALHDEPHGVSGRQRVRGDTGGVLADAVTGDGDDVRAG